MTIAIDWDVKQQNKQTNKPDYIRASTKDFITIAQMRPLSMCALSYCGARDLLCEIRLDYFNSMCTRAAKCLVRLWTNTGLVVSLPLADMSSTKILL